jgi:hypothetical protein
MTALECKVAMVISRLVKFELLLELKIEQKHGTSLVNSFPAISVYARIFYAYFLLVKNMR